MIGRHGSADNGGGTGTPRRTRPLWTRVAARVVELIVLLLVGGFMFLALRGSHPAETPVKTFMVENATEQTGALNVVTAIYLGYRAFDTLGETIVLLLAVSGVAVLLEFRK